MEETICTIDEFVLMGKNFGVKKIDPDLYEQIAEIFLTKDSTEQRKRVDLKMLANYYFSKYPMPKSMEIVDPKLDQKKRSK